MLTILCIASYFKGEDFLRACKATGSKVLLITGKKLEDKDWPRESVDEFFYVEESTPGVWNMDNVISGLAWVMRRHKVDRIVALDDFDVEKATLLRESFRIPGMGQTTGRFFRDKLAMRMRAAEMGVPVPGFSPLFNDDEINAFIAQYPGPWLVKPRSEASATGIRKVHNGHELWEAVHALGDHRHNYLVEQFKPGGVYHVDALSRGGEVIFSRVSKYLNPPFDVAHGGGIFQTATVPFGSEDDQALQALNAQVMKAFRMQHSASHTEFIRCHEDGKYYFLETASRVGGAHIAEMVEVSSGINLWAEWAKLEVAVAQGITYELPAIRNDHAGIIISLARQQYPDTSGFQDAEIVWRMSRDHHVGLIMQSPSHERVITLLNEYAGRIFADFHASAPVPDRPSA
ncbi:MAG: ATPase [Bacteroidetes bacterium]|nr:MAG: ATPase [Bacteroidota bacterium]